MEKSGQGGRKTVKWRVILLVSLALLIASLALLFVFSWSVREAKEPDVEQIKADLLGEDMLLLERGVAWHFGSFSEFQDFYIKNKNKIGGVIEYDISMRLKDIPTEKLYLADVVIIYRKVENKWGIVSVSPRLWKELD